jgi:exonuclease III
MRGGGVGFFVREGLNFKERTNLDFHTEKIFENLVLEVSFPNKTIIISNIYRSPTPPRGIPIARHMENFLSTLDAHLSLLSELDKPTYVFLDANINLLNIENNPVCT